MTNPPDFVMYVVMAKLPHDAVFNPVWNRERGLRHQKSFATQRVRGVKL